VLGLSEYTLSNTRRGHCPPRNTLDAVFRGVTASYEHQPRDRVSGPHALPELGPWVCPNPHDRDVHPTLDCATTAARRSNAAH
jgi:hypothetical protein